MHKTVNSPQVNLDAFFVGAGAVGCFYAWLLQRQGARVGIQTSAARAILQHNVAIHTTLYPSAAQIFKPDLVVSDLASMPHINPPKFLFVTTKVLASSYRSVAQSIKPLLGADTTIVLLQNGIDIESVFSDLYPHHMIISGLAFVCVSRVSETSLSHTSHGRVVVGCYQQGKVSDSETKDRLAWLANKWSDVTCSITDNILKQRFKKLVWNAAFNPLSVLGGDMKTDKILEVAEHTCRNIMLEIIGLASSYDCHLRADLADDMIDDTKKMPPYETSMLLDKKNGRPLEVQAILGNTINLAREKKLNLPIVQAMYDIALMQGYHD